MSKTTMKASKTTWGQMLEDQAEIFEAKARMARLLAMAESEVDGAAIACDLFRAGFHAAATRQTRAHGRKLPAPPAPISKMMTHFADALRAKLESVGKQLSQPQVARLAAIAPRVLECLERQDGDVCTAVAQLFPMPPEAIALWVTLHLDQIEARFAS